MDTTMIRKRRGEVQQEIGRLNDRIADLEKELADLDVTLRTIERLTGAKWSPSGAIDKRESEEDSGGKPENIPTMPEMISDALEHYSLLGGAKPKDVRNWIAEHYWPSVKVDNVASILWRMWKRGQLVKEDSRYLLPHKSKAADAEPTMDTSAASSSNPKQAREAGSGGGT